MPRRRVPFPARSKPMPRMPSSGLAFAWAGAASRSRPPGMTGSRRRDSGAVSRASAGVGGLGCEGCIAHGTLLRRRFVCMLRKDTGNAAGGVPLSGQSGTSDGNQSRTVKRVQVETVAQPGSIAWMVQCDCSDRLIRTIRDQRSSSMILTYESRPTGSIRSSTRCLGTPTSASRWFASFPPHRRSRISNPRLPLVARDAVG